MRRPRSLEKDLFETIAPQEADGAAEVELLMVVVHSTDRAWLLRRADRRDALPQWVPLSVATRAAPPDDDIFTMPRRAARDRGWL